MSCLLRCRPSWLHHCPYRRWHSGGFPPVSLKGACVIVIATSLFIPAIHWPSFSSCIILIVLASVFSGYIMNLLPPLATPLILPLKYCNHRLCLHAWHKPVLATCWLNVGLLCVCVCVCRVFLFVGHVNRNCPPLFKARLSHGFTSQHHIDLKSFIANCFLECQVKYPPHN